MTSPTPHSPGREAVSETAFKAMCHAHSFCPTDLPHLDRMRWMAKHMESALLAAKQEELDRMREALKDAISELEKSGMAYDHPKLKSLRAALSPIQGAGHEIL